MTPYRGKSHPDIINKSCVGVKCLKFIGHFPWLVYIALFYDVIFEIMFPVFPAFYRLTLQMKPSF